MWPGTNTELCLLEITAHNSWQHVFQCCVIHYFFIYMKWTEKMSFKTNQTNSIPIQYSIYLGEASLMSSDQLHWLWSITWCHGCEICVLKVTLTWAGAGELKHFCCLWEERRHGKYTTHSRVSSANCEHKHSSATPKHTHERIILSLTPLA